MKNILVTGANGQLGNEMRVLSLENNQCHCDLCCLYGRGQGGR